MQINQIYSPSLDYTEGYRLHVNFKGIAKLRLNGAFSMNVFVGYDKSDYVVDASTPTKDNPYFAGGCNGHVLMAAVPWTLGVGSSHLTCLAITSQAHDIDNIDFR